MHNPFLEVVDETTDCDLIEQSKNGSQSAVEKLILRHQAWIYNIALRMVFHPHDAEEVTQEVLLKAITRLSTFNGESKFRTWLYRITTNHVLNMKRRGGEKESQTFSSYADAINGTPDLDLPDPKTVPVEVPLLVEEAKISCTAGMLMCLDRKQRLIFVLAEIFGVSDSVGSEILEMTSDNFRQSLSRARRDLYQFMNNQCGLVNTKNPCRCPKKTKGFIDAGHVDPSNLQFASSHITQIRSVAADTYAHMDEVVNQQNAALFRDHPVPRTQRPFDLVATNVAATRHPRDLALKLRKDPWLCHSPSSMVSKVLGGQTMSRLKSKTALVTGASKGIGAGIALELAAAGASVVVNYASDKSGAEAIANSILEGGGQAIAIQGDVSNSADVTRMFHQAANAFGSIDILVNNAGVYQAMPITQMTESEFHREMNVNLLGPLLTIRESLQYFGSTGGSIINIGSAASRSLPAEFSIYAASKSGLDAITGVLAKELASRGIRVNSVNPGATLSEGTKEAGLIWRRERY